MLQLSMGIAVLKWPQRIFYRSIVRAALLDKGGVPFEDWFVELASRLWGSDFEPVRAQGRRGDLKCDGRRISTGAIYQCYAPRRVDERAIHKKLRTDFDGAKAIWKSKMKEWVVVINDREGLDVSSTTELNLLREENPECRVLTLGPSGIESLVLSLPKAQLADFCGSSLDETDYQQWRLSFSDVSIVVEHLVATEARFSNDSLDPPPPDKIRINSLESDIETLLVKGNILTRQVEAFFSRTDQVELEARVAEKLSGAYLEMKEEELDPSQIFYQLVDLCGGLGRPIGEQRAVLGVITYFFNKCDIFESEELVS